MQLALPEVFVTSIQSNKNPECWPMSCIVSLAKTRGDGKYSAGIEGERKKPAIGIQMCHRSSKENRGQKSEDSTGDILLYFDNTLPILRPGDLDPRI
jgi:hypothetical protein